MTARSDAEARRLMVLLMRRQGRERDAQAQWERRGKSCPIQRPMLDRW